MENKIIGVYAIKNTANSKVYIGSSISINERWREHKRDLKSNKHHSQHLQKAWNKYGEDCFEFNILEECNREETLIREQYYLDKFQSFNKNKGYNIAKNSSAPMMGRKFSEETLAKLSEGVKNRDESCWLRGEDKFNSKFKDEDIVEIKRMISEGCKIVDISKLYDVGANTITQIKTGERWSHIKTEYDNLIIQTPRQKLTEENVIEIKKMLIECNLTIIEIANIYNLTFANISSIKKLKSWKNVGVEYNTQLEERLCVRKLDKNKVIKIKKLLLQGKTCKEISIIFNVHSTSINYIKNNKTWKDVVITEKDLQKEVN